MNLAAKETIYTKDFQTNLENANQPEWLKTLREKAFAYFTENGFPTPQNEEWKYTNVAPLASGHWTAGTGQSETQNISQFVFDESKESVLVFTNGVLNRELSNTNAIKDASVLSFSEASENEKSGAVLQAKLASLVDSEKNGFTALNTAFIGEGVFVHLPKNTKIDAPVQLLFLTDDGKISFPRVLIVAEEFAEATFVETYNRIDETKFIRRGGR